jgi:hypothetical protein
MMFSKPNVYYKRRLVEKTIDGSHIIQIAALDLKKQEMNLA